MKNKIAIFFSYILHPLLAPAAGIFILTHSGTYVADISQEIKNLLYLSVVTLTFVLPVCLIPFYMYFKIVRSVELSEKSERLVPLIITLIAYITTFVLIRRLPVSQMYERFMFASCVALLGVLLISTFWKISAHMTGLGGLVGLVIALSKKVGTDMMMYLLVLVLLSGIAGYARMRSNSHSAGQVYIGFLLGLLTVFALIMV